MNSTIVAIATPPGESAIAVIRASGADSIELTQRVFTGKNLLEQASHTLHFGRIVDPETEMVVDEVLVSLFLAPRSYTGETSVEISTHGGTQAVYRVLEVLVKAGMRHAEPGEFTQRAFLNGKLDLSQAEAVADVIHAKSKHALLAANRQLEGRLGEYVRRFRQQIIDMTALIELELDFIEEDVEFASRDKLLGLISDLVLAIDELVETYEAGRLIKDGVRVVILGRPNAGKSTLLNALIGRQRAIVSEIAGTTRDTIDADWTFEGLYFKLVDTAGIRSTTDVIEKQGVQRSFQAAHSADVVVYLIDAAHPDPEQSLAEFEAAKTRLGDKMWILARNKMDLETGVPHPDTPFDVHISAKSGTGIGELKQRIKQKALAHAHPDVSRPLLTTERHKRALEKTREHVMQARSAIEQGLSGELLSIDLRAALSALGSITGEITNEDVLDSIFSRFCIGK